MNFCTHVTIPGSGSKNRYKILPSMIFYFLMSFSFNKTQSSRISLKVYLFVADPQTDASNFTTDKFLNL